VAFREIQRSSAALLASILAVAAGARVLFLGNALLWTDEAYSVHLAHLEFGRLLEKLLSESTPPLYYMLLRLWILAFGDGEAAVRALSVVFGLGAIAGVYLVARRFLSSRAAAVAAFLLALAPIHIAHSQQARMYALLSLLAVGLAGFGLGFSRTRATRDLVGFALCSLLLLLTHNVSLWIVIGFTLAVAWETGQARAVVALATAQTLTLLAYLPWLAVVVHQVGREATVLDWFLPHWHAKSPLLHLADTLWSFSFGPFPYLLPALSSPVAESWLVRGALLAVLAAGVVRAFHEPTVRLLVVASAITLACALTYSSLAQPVYIPGRTDHYLLPVFVWILGVGLVTPRLRAATWLGLVAYGILALSVLAPYYAHPSRDSSRRFLEEIRTRSSPGDIVVTTGLTFAEAEHGLRGLPVRLEPYPRSAREHPGYLSWAEILSDPGRLADDAREIARTAARLPPANRVFVILVPHAAQGPLVTELPRVLDLDPDSGEVFSQSVIGTSVRLFVWKPHPR